MRASIRVALSIAVLLPLAFRAMGAQVAAESRGTILLEHRFGDAPDSVTMRLQRGTVYRVELVGTGTLEMRSVRRPDWTPLLVPLPSDTSSVQRYEMHPRHSGDHTIRVTGVAPQATTVLRLVTDAAAMHRVRSSRERRLAVGALVQAGAHTGYRLDPTGGDDPSGGGDLEACVLIATGSRLASCLGTGRQRFPDGSDVTWLFFEEQVRLTGGAVLGGRRADIGLTLRLGTAPDAGPRHLNPSLLGLGAQVRLQLAPGGTERHRGLSGVLAWQHGRLGNAPETEFYDTDRITAGFAWVP